MNTFPVPKGSPCLLRPPFQPFCPQPPSTSHPRHFCSFTLASVRGRRPVDRICFSRFQELFPAWVLVRTSPNARWLVGRLGRIGFTLCHVSHVTCYGLVVHFRQLPTPCYHDAVAFGYRRVNVSPDGDSHPAGCTPSQAHERARPRAQQRRRPRCNDLFADVENPGGTHKC